MKVLVTGGAGFIGSALVRQLLHKTNHYVINCDAMTYAGNHESVGEHGSNSRYSFEHVDIRDRTKLQELFKKYRPDWIMHLAAESHVDRSIDNPSNFISTNINGTFNLLEESRNHFNGLSKASRESFRFHHISTDEVYGDLGRTNDLFTENASYNPSSPYSASKAASDHLVRAWWRTFKLPTIITNCSNNYGPYHFPEKLIPHIILNAIKGNALPIYGDGLQVRDWLYVEDHVKALIAVISEGVVGETYNIGGHNEKTNLEVVETICNLLEELSNKKPNGVNKYLDLITYVKDRPGHDVRYAIDASKIERELGWTPEETFETGMRKTVQWYLDNVCWWDRNINKNSN